MKRGEVWWAALPEPWGQRPVLLLARNESYARLTWLIVAPLTTTIRTLQTVVVVDRERDGVPERSAIALDNIQLTRKDWLRERITELSVGRMDEVERAIHFALALRS